MPSLTTTDAGLDAPALHVLSLMGGIFSAPGRFSVSERNGEIFIEAMD